MRTVRYEEMLPHETVAARTAKPVAYLPLGILEWHGEHCAVGLDGVKAHELCIRAARRGGGVCMPVQFWGEDRETNVHDRNFDPKGKLADAMGLPHGFMAPGHMNGHVVSYQLLLHHMLYQIKSLGFRVIFMLYGHYPLVYDAQPVAREFMEANPGMRVYAGMESDPIRDAFPESEHEEFLRPLHDKHAGKWETSILKTLRPELVDLAQIPPEPGSTIVSIIDPECDIDVAEDPRCDDLDEYGAKITAKVIEGMNIVCDRLLAELEDEADKR